MPDENHFKDKFGQIVVSPTYIERVRSEDGGWDEIENNFEAGDVIDKVHYSEIEDLDLQPESRKPMILIKVEGGWRRLFLEDAEQAEKVFKRLRYRYQSYLQNH